MVDIIIATYNRFEKAKKLALNLLKVGGFQVNKIIIVDSTDNQLNKRFKSKRIIHFVTNHTNQP